MRKPSKSGLTHFCYTIFLWNFSPYITYSHLSSHFINKKRVTFLQLDLRRNATRCKSYYNRMKQKFQMVFGENFPKLLPQHQLIDRFDQIDRLTSGDKCNRRTVHHGNAVGSIVTIKRHREGWEFCVIQVYRHGNLLLTIRSLFREFRYWERAESILKILNIKLFVLICPGIVLILIVLIFRCLLIREPHMSKVTCFSAALSGKTKYRRIRL